VRVLVIGGTGFMGPVVVRHLVDMGHQVTVFHRSSGGAALPPQVAHLTGDRAALSDHAPALRRLGADVVLDMVLFDLRQAEALMHTFAGAVPRVVVASSVDVYRNYGGLLRQETAPPDPVPLTEDAPLRSRLHPYRLDAPRAADDPQRWMDDYDKIPVERRILSDRQIVGTVLRLPMVYGPRDGQHRLRGYLKRMDDGRPAILLPEAAAAWRVSRGYVDDMAWAIALAVVDSRAQGQVYNVAEPTCLTEAEWVERVGRAAGWTGRLVVLPDPLLPESLRMPEDFRYPLEVSSVKIRRDLGYAERISPDQAMRLSVAWEREHPPAASPDPFDYAAEDAALQAL
jgi:nucleoside-diphosphate-sugar epimerase